MPSYSVRTIIRWPKRPGQSKTYLYEERITAWNACCLDEAIDRAEDEARNYAEREGFEPLGLLQGYWMFDAIDRVDDCTELFSLLRESDLEPSEYLDQFFDTGCEHQRPYGD